MTCMNGLVIVRGGGDLATGTIYRLWKAGFQVLSLEVERPLVVRRTVAVAEAVFDGFAVVEGMRAEKISSCSEFDPACGVNILVDPEGESIKRMRPQIVIDAIIAKRNTGTYREMAPLVIGLGPGFSAPNDVHVVIETNRGHNLGRAIWNGCAEPNTGHPGDIMGYGRERLLRAPASGPMQQFKRIGDSVLKGELIAEVAGKPVTAGVFGVVRGLIHPSVIVTEGLKIGDVDPRNDASYCKTISDKALSIAGGVLEAILSR
ncbi:EF2563 family selenium-dependent molybdenum hydroxylase system protein [Synergistaceae bacterium OttesenSCG-928-D05]|nr:EF2563 family selenium-dependent molybdenum hydroxylase system protein [Synergistaceae bacterium OttesenSCG-928-D05]